jgi:hypothetical protein
MLAFSVRVAARLTYMSETRRDKFCTPRTLIRFDLAMDKREAKICAQPCRLAEQSTSSAAKRAWRSL